MLPCGDCDGRAFGTDRALAQHREALHQDEANNLIGHIYRPERPGDMNSPCQICGMPRAAQRHNRKPNRPPSWER